MKPRGVFLLAVVLCAATHVMAQPARTLQADRIAEKLWWIIDITKEHCPSFRRMSLEAPDERLALSFPGECAPSSATMLSIGTKPGSYPRARTSDGHTTSNLATGQAALVDERPHEG
jgi:hypothetical protein